MSKNLDYDNLSEDDKDWLRARGWGNRIPGEEAQPNPGIVLDANASAEDILKQTPNTGTATVSDGTPINGIGEAPSADEAGGGYTRDDYMSWKVSDLQDEVAERNENRSEQDAIKPSGGKKADLADALVADDEAQASSDANA